MAEAGAQRWDGGGALGCRVDGRLEHGGLWRYALDFVGCGCEGKCGLVPRGPPPFASSANIANRRQKSTPIFFTPKFYSQVQVQVRLLVTFLPS